MGSSGLEAGLHASNDERGDPGAGQREFVVWERLEANGRAADGLKAECGAGYRADDAFSDEHDFVRGGLIIADRGLKVFPDVAFAG